MPSIDRIYACVLEEDNVRGNEKEKENKDGKVWEVD